jgi:MFS family permease
VLTRIVVWWSVFTALTGACSGFLTLLVVRFLFGAGEAGAFPNAARVIARWYPVHERGRVQGVMLAAAQLGAALAPAATAHLIETAGWRWSFAAFGLAGVAWAAGFWRWYRDDPADHPGANAAELATIRADASAPPIDPGPVPWRAALANRGLIVLGCIMIVGAFFTYFFYSWFPKYLVDARGIDNLRAGTLATVVLAGPVAGMLLGGWLADRITRRAPDPVTARRYLGVACYLTAAGCLFAGIRSDDPLALAGLWSASMCAMHITLPNWWSAAIPQCGRHVGALFGLLNGAGVVGALATQWFVGAFSDWRAAAGYSDREQWDPLFDVYVGVLVLGAVAWWSYRYRPLAGAPVE